MKRILSLDGILYVEKVSVKMACLLDKMNTYSYSAPRCEFTRDREMKKMGIPQFKMDLYLYSFSSISWEYSLLALSNDLLLYFSPDPVSLRTREWYHFDV